MIYFDNATTSYPKPQCLRTALQKIGDEQPGSANRSFHQGALETNRKLYGSRMRIASFFNIPSCQRLVFTYNCTYGINLALYGVLGPKTKRVLVDQLSHNAVVRPLTKLAQRYSFSVEKLQHDPDGYIDIEALERQLATPCDLLIITHASNAFGVLQPLAAIGGIARSKAVPMLVDAAQTAGTAAIDVQKQNISLLAFSGHKGLLGPPGIGGLYVEEGVALESWILGGTGSDSHSEYQPRKWPDVLESGTINHWGAVALAETVKHLQAKTRDGLEPGDRALAAVLYLVDALAQPDFKRIKVYAATKDRQARVGVVSLRVEGVDPSRTALELDRRGFAVRAGLHCAPWAHMHMGTYPQGTVRVSPGHGVSKQDLQLLLVALREIVEKFSCGNQ